MNGRSGGLISGARHRQPHKQKPYTGSLSVGRVCWCPNLELSLRGRCAPTFLLRPLSPLSPLPPPSCQESDDPSHDEHAAQENEARHLHHPEEDPGRDDLRILDDEDEEKREDDDEEGGTKLITAHRSDPDGGGRRAKHPESRNVHEKWTGGTRHTSTHRPFR